MRMYFISLLKVFIDKINNSKNHPLKINIALYYHFLKLKRCLELICSFQNKAKNKFILLRILQKQSIAQFLRCGNVYHDVTGFELCGSHNIQLSKYLENETLLFLQRENSFLIIILCPQSHNNRIREMIISGGCHPVFCLFVCFVFFFGGGRFNISRFNMLPLQNVVFQNCTVVIAVLLQHVADP